MRRDQKRGVCEECGRDVALRNPMIFGQPRPQAIYRHKVHCNYAHENAHRGVTHDDWCNGRRSEPV